MSQDQPSRRKRCWFRISLREMVLLVTACCCLLALLFSTPHRQRRAVDVIRAHGGSVRYKSRDSESSWLVVRESDSAWQRRIFGERVGRIDVIDLSNTSVTDSDLLRLSPLTDTTVLDATQTQISGEGLRVLRSMPLIWKLDLRSTRVRDASLVHLRGLEELEELDLSHTQVAGRGLTALESLPRLKSLDLSGTAVNDDSLAHVAGPASLEGLYLDRTNITDAGLIHLQSCANLEHLSLEGTQVSAAGLARLSSLRRLQQVKAMGMDLTLRDLSDIERLQKKVEYVTKSRVVRDPELHSAILKAWQERQQRIASFDVVGVHPGESEPAAYDVRCAVDAQGRVHHSSSPPQASYLGRAFINIFDGSSTHFRFTDSLHVPKPRESAGDTTGWHRDATAFPIAIALRPLLVFRPTELEVTRDVETVDGYQCLVMHHAEGKVWVDPAREFLPVRFSFIFRGATDQQVDLSYRDDDQVGWVPVSWAQSYFSADRTLARKLETQVSRCTFNESLPDDLFRFE